MKEPAKPGISPKVREPMKSYPTTPKTLKSKIDLKNPPKTGQSSNEKQSEP